MDAKERALLLKIAYVAIIRFVRPALGAPFLKTRGRTVDICGLFAGQRIVAIMLPPGYVWLKEGSPGSGRFA